MTFLTEDNILSDIKYFVVKRWRIGHLKLIRIAGEFDSLDDARQFCCKQIYINFDKNAFDEEYKMTFWDRTKKIVFDII